MHLASYSTCTNTDAWTRKLRKQSPGRKRVRTPQSHKIKRQGTEKNPIV